LISERVELVTFPDLRRRPECVPRRHALHPP